jgi:hypothetical protein
LLQDFVTLLLGDEAGVDDDNEFHEVENTGEMDVSITNFMG